MQFSSSYIHYRDIQHVQSYLSPQEFAVSCGVSRVWQQSAVAIRQKIQDNGKVRCIRPGLYRAILQRDIPVYFFMIKLKDKKEADRWQRYQTNTLRLTSDSNSLRDILFQAGRNSPIPYNDMVAQVTGFTTEEEYLHFIAHTDCRQMATMLMGIEGGASAAGRIVYRLQPGKEIYISYITTNPNFSMPDAKEGLSYKEYVETYKEIILSVQGRVFPSNKVPQNEMWEEKYYQAMGISRTQRYEVMGIFKTVRLVQFTEIEKRRYGNIAMPFHGLTAAAMQQEYPKKKFMTVAPAASMGALIVKTVKKNDGFLIRHNGERVDLSEEKVNPRSSMECPIYAIHISALIRIYWESLGLRSPIEDEERSRCSIM